MSAVKELINEVGGGFVDSIVPGGRGGWSLSDLMDWGGVGEGGTDFGGSVGQTRKDDIKIEEDKMVDEMEKLTVDPDTDLPFLPEHAEKVESAEEQKESDVAGLSFDAKSRAEQRVADLYKKGAITHGKTISQLRDTSELFSRKVGDIDRTFKETIGGAEDLATGMLDKIKASILNVEDIYSKTGSSDSVYRTAFPKKTYDVSTLGQVKPKEDVMEKMYEYDYLTGRKRGETP